MIGNKITLLVDPNFIIWLRRTRSFWEKEKDGTNYGTIMIYEYHCQYELGASVCYYLFYEDTRIPAAYSLSTKA